MKHKKHWAEPVKLGVYSIQGIIGFIRTYHQAVHKFKTHGIKTGKVSVDWKQMQKRKNDVVDNTTKGIEFLMNKNKIHVEKGLGEFKSPTEVELKMEKNPQRYQQKNG